MYPEIGVGVRRPASSFGFSQVVARIRTPDPPRRTW